MIAIPWLAERPIAHRGLHDLNKTCWENTLSAFRKAVHHDYAIECDVHLSSDGVPVVFHDDDLKRLTGRDGQPCDHPVAELTAMKIGTSNDTIPTLGEMLKTVAGKVPLVIELKGTEGKDDGLVAKVAGLLAGYKGKASIMSFDHWLIRQFPKDAPGIPAGLTALGQTDKDIEGHFAMLAYDLSFVSYCLADMPNRFVSLVREQLSMPVISWTVRDQTAADLTFKYADQMTFEGFIPEVATV
ncbi:glycerophosphodiester phosphodiesterase [Mesorhizobium koreense]|uniref:glycerophosphodiester phosphodiesterase n=1 Tax=Mesorhizobium koreense TaxID=3074855 RepID=UPI00287BAA6F|nr:glycerophosphodiester phosphodiesterase [Mesorhizobium sp. WR6]